MWKEEMVAYFKELSLQLSSKAKKHRNLTHYSRLRVDCTRIHSI